MFAHCYIMIIKCIYFIFRPDQPVDLICDCLAVKRTPCVHAVAYNSSSPAAIVRTDSSVFNMHRDILHLTDWCVPVIGDCEADGRRFWGEISPVLCCTGNLKINRNERENIHNYLLNWHETEITYSGAKKYLDSYTFTLKNSYYSITEYH